MKANKTKTHAVPRTHTILQKARLAAHWHAFVDFDRADRKTSAAACLAYREKSAGDLVFWPIFERLSRELRLAVGLALAICLDLVCAACGGSPFTSLPDPPPNSPSPPPSALPDGGGDAAGRSGDGGAGSLPPCACLGDLSGVGLGDFTIGFTVRTSMRFGEPGYAALLNQRSSCDASHPGWDVLMRSDGTVGLQIYDGSNVFDDAKLEGAAVNDGAEHRVVLRRTGGGSVVVMTVDGRGGALLGEPPEALSGTLAPLDTGQEPICAGNMAAPALGLQGEIGSACVAAGACEVGP